MRINITINPRNYITDIDSISLIYVVLFFILLVIIPTLVGEAKSFPELTALEATDLAYQEAKKWDKEAILWYLCPSGRSLDYHWGENELAWEWDIMFARARDEQIYMLKIVDKQIVSQEETGFIKRISPPQPNFPKNQPIISLKQAAQIIFNQGAPSWERPNVVYIIDNSLEELRGRPVWFFLFWSQFSSYAVDGINGGLLKREYFDPLTLKKINPEEVKSEFYPEQVESIEGENYIYDFFETINEGKTEQYFSMMDQDLAGNAATQKMWKTSFSSLELIKVVSLYLEEKNKWHDQQPLYKVTIYAISKPGAPYYGWDEGRNTRWISIAPRGDSWKIVAIDTSP